MGPRAARVRRRRCARSGMGEKTRRAYGVDLAAARRLGRAPGPRPGRPRPPRAAPLRRRALRARRRRKSTVARKLAAIRTFYRAPRRARRAGGQPGRSGRRAQARGPTCRACSSRPRSSELLERDPRRRRRSSCATGRCSSSPTRPGCAPRSSSTSTSASLDADAEEVRVDGKGGTTRVVPAGEHAWRAIEPTWPARGPRWRGRAPSRRCSSRRAAGGSRRRTSGAGCARSCAAPRSQGGRDPAHPAPLLRDPPAGGRRRPAQHPGAARACLDQHDPDLHSGRVEAPQDGLCAGASRVRDDRRTRWWRPTSRRSS